MEILFLSTWFPFPCNNGSKIRIYNLLCGLAQRHQVTLVSFTDQPDRTDSIPELKGICQQIETLPLRNYHPCSAKSLAGFISSAPRSLVDTYSPQMAQAVQQKIANGCDVIIASEIGMSGYSHLFQQQPALLEDIELGAIFDQYNQSNTVLTRWRYGLTWVKTSRYVASRLKHFSACTVVSERERKTLARAVPTYKAVETIPNCIDLMRYESMDAVPQPNTLIFTGALTYAANFEAVSFFLREIYPQVRRDVPDVRLQITGQSDGVSWPPLPVDANVQLLGYVADVLPLIASSQVSVAPLRSGGGTRLKILEAMALGTPVVSTTKGAEGLEVEHGKHLLIADKPNDFAVCVIRLLQDADLRRHLSLNARQLVQQKYDWRVVMPRFLDLVERVARS